VADTALVLEGLDRVVPVAMVHVRGSAAAGAGAGQVPARCNVFGRFRADAVHVVDVSG
jgi:hypothetical protein